MNSLYIGTKNLKRVIDEKKPLGLVVLNTCEQINLSKTEMDNMRRTVNGALRHFSLLRFQAMQGFKEFMYDDDEIYLLILALYQLRYAYKSTAKFITIRDALQASQDMKLRLEPSRLEDFLKDAAANPFRFPKEILNDPYEYNALFFSVPSWIVRMWAKQYGDEATMNILRSLGQKKIVFVRRNALKKPLDEMIDEGIYENCSFGDDAFIYHGVMPFLKTDDSKLGKVFSMDLSTQMLAEKLPLGEVKTCYQSYGSSGRFASSLGIRIHEQGGKVSSLFKDALSYRKARYLFERLGLNETCQAYQDKERYLADAMKDKPDLVICSPDCSELGTINRNPVWLTWLQEKDMPGFIKGEKDALEKSEKLVKEGGMLLYLVRTMNLKETKEVIYDFVKKHKEYQTLSRKQIFPYDYSSDGIYYALLRKTGYGK